MYLIEKLTLNYPKALLFGLLGLCALFPHRAAARSLVLPPVVSWTPYGQGFQTDTSVTHGSRAGLRCINSDPRMTSGAMYTLTLNQTEPTPILVSGWSRAQDVDGVPDNEYSLYIDLTFTDGSSLWGQTAPFATGTHPWQQRHLTLFPTKPLRSLNIYALFRSHAGTAWFDDFAAQPATADTLFDGQKIAPPTLTKSGSQSELGGWFVRDVAAGTPLIPLRPGQTALGLRLENVRTENEKQVLRGSLRNTRTVARAVTLYYAERFTGVRSVWWNDIRSKEPVQTNREYGNLTAVNAGATGQLSLYPFGCLTGRGMGRALGLPPDLGPRVMRIGYHARSQTLFLACDLALAGRGDPAGHDRAAVAVARFGVDPQWGFRDAAAKWYALFPEAYARRSRAEGIWMPFTDPAKVSQSSDFHFGYHEGDNSLATDRQLGILSFHYVEPMTYWMPMAKEVPRTYAEALAQVQRQAAGGDEIARRQSEAVLTSGSCDASGRFNVAFRDAPWCNGAVWVLNPNPRLPVAAGQWSKARLNADLRNADLTANSPVADLPDGLYLDSLEAWADVLDYRPESLRASSLPATFAADTFQPALPTWFSVYEGAAALSHDQHSHHRLLMANSVPWRFAAFMPLLDVMGTETNMFADSGEWAPEPDAVFNLRRTLSGKKPYLLLLNTDFSKTSYDKMALYFQRCLFYGIYPSMFSANAADHPYWESPALYDRDRPLFRKYIPVIQRLSAAGWEPVTWAQTDRPAVQVERFGTDYLTVLNTGAAPTTVTVHIDLAHLASTTEKSAQWTIRDGLTGRLLATVPARDSAAVSLSLAPSETGVLALHLIR